MFSTDEISVYKPKEKADTKLVLEFLIAIYVDYHYVSDPTIRNVHPMTPRLEIMKGWHGHLHSIMTGIKGANVAGGVRPLNLGSATKSSNEKEGAGWHRLNMEVPEALYGDKNLLSIIPTDSPLLFSVFCTKVFNDAIDLSGIKSLKDHMEAHLKAEADKKKRAALSAEEKYEKRKKDLFIWYLDPSKQKKGEDPMAKYFEEEENSVGATLPPVEKPHIEPADLGTMLGCLLQKQGITKIEFDDSVIAGALDDPEMSTFQNAHQHCLNSLDKRKAHIKEQKSSARKEKRAQKKKEESAKKEAEKKKEAETPMKTATDMTDAYAFLTPVAATNGIAEQLSNVAGAKKHHLGEGTPGSPGKKSRTEAQANHADEEAAQAQLEANEKAAQAQMEAEEQEAQGITEAEAKAEQDKKEAEEKAEQAQKEANELETNEGKTDALVQGSPDPLVKAVSQDSTLGGSDQE